MSYVDPGVVAYYNAQPQLYDYHNGNGGISINNNQNFQRPQLSTSTNTGHLTEESLEHFITNYKVGQNGKGGALGMQNVTSSMIMPMGAPSYIPAPNYMQALPQQPIITAPTYTVMAGPNMVAPTAGHYTNELANYKQAVQRMAGDLLSMRKKVTTLNGENNRLAMQTKHYDDIARTAVNPHVVESMPRGDVTDAYVSVRGRLLGAENKLQKYREQLQALQNELIRKNDGTVKLMKTAHEHVKLQETVQKMQDKLAHMKKLEATVRHQQIVIGRMEKALRDRLSDLPGDNKRADEVVARELYESLTDENRQLREQVAIARERYQVKKNDAALEESGKLQLMLQLDATEARRLALERQLDEQSRDWGGERAQILLKLREARKGFAVGDLEPLQTTRRFRELQIGNDHLKL